MSRYLLRVTTVLVLALSVWGVSLYGKDLIGSPGFTLDEGGVAHAARPAAGLTPQVLPTLSASTPTATRFAADDTTVVLESDYTECDPIETQTISAHCQNGEYFFRRKDTGGTEWIFYPNSYDDTVIEVDARATSNISVRYGVIWRLDSSGKNFYILGLTSEGHYGLFRLDNNQYVTLVPYTISDAINKTTGANGSATNHIRVIAQGDQIAVYVNDRWLTTVRDTNLSAGRVALFVEAPDQPNAEAAFDDLRVSRINRPLALSTSAAPTATRTQSSLILPPLDLGATSTPNPGAPSSTPTPTRTGSPISTSGTVLAETGYDECEPIEDEDTFARCENGEFVFLKKAAGGSQWIYYRTSYDDAVVEVDARLVRGASDVGYGLLFRLDANGNNYYLFDVTRDGRAGLFRYTRPNFTTLIDLTPLDAINPGTGTNHLKLIAQGDQLSAYVNDQLLGTVRDTRLSVGRVALYIESDEPNAEVAFDNLRVSDVSQSLAGPTGGATRTRVSATATRTSPATTRTLPTPTRTQPTATPQPESSCPLNLGEAGLLISNNYEGTLMRFTIGGGQWGTHDYDIPGDGKWYLIRMPPGKYTYSASIAGRGTAHGEPYEYQVGVCRSIRFGP